MCASKEPGFTRTQIYVKNEIQINKKLGVTDKICDTGITVPVDSYLLVKMEAECPSQSSL